MDIIFNPSVNKENKYIDIMVRSLREKGYNVHALDDFFSSWRHFQSIKLVHLNWFENLDDTSFLRAFKSFVRKMFVLTIIRISKKKLVWTMHNRVSHEKNLSFFSQWITYFLVLWAHKIIIHSEMSRSILNHRQPRSSGKIFYLPHPDFIDIYGPLPAKVSENIPSTPLVLLFIGAVKPYKNIELLINAVSPFKEKVKLIISGNPSSAAYRQKISETASFGNIELRLNFIPDHEIPLLIQQSDLLVLPYDLTSSLNSGTVILAFSYRKTVICPEIGTIKDLANMKKNVLHYSYNSEQEHLNILSQKIEYALHLKMEDASIYNSLGNKMYEHVRQVHHKNLVGEKLINLYRSLLN